MNFTIRVAIPSDLSEIMKIEQASFIPQIQELPELFLERINVFGEGFLIFETKVCGKTVTAGYFSTELWQQVPETAGGFMIGHSIASSHKKDGRVLYISSFAILPEFRGNGNGKKLFSQAMAYLESKFCLEKSCLMVNENWGGAHHIYSSNGFSEIFRIQNIFPAENNSFTNGIVMVR